MKPPKSLVSKKRPVNTYAELWHGSKILLERAQAEIRGSKWLWMASLTLTAFSLEAYLTGVSDFSSPLGNFIRKINKLTSYRRKTPLKDRKNHPKSDIFQPDSIFLLDICKTYHYRGLYGALT
jgi:hypothetical protein